MSGFDSEWDYRRRTGNYSGENNPYLPNYYNPYLPSTRPRYTGPPYHFDRDCYLPESGTPHYTADDAPVHSLPWNSKVAKTFLSNKAKPKRSCK
jgi:hypothetical protein